MLYNDGYQLHSDLQHSKVLRQHNLCIAFTLPSHHLHTEPDLALVDVTAHEHLAAAATYICQLHTYMSWSPVMSHNDMP